MMFSTCRGSEGTAGDTLDVAAIQLQTNMASSFNKEDQNLHSAGRPAGAARIGCKKKKATVKMPVKFCFQDDVETLDGADQEDDLCPSKIGKPTDEVTMSHMMKLTVGDSPATVRLYNPDKRTHHDKASPQSSERGR